MVYYWKSSKDTKAVWHSINMIARAIEHSGFASFVYDEAGNVTGVRISGGAYMTSEG